MPFPDEVWCRTVVDFFNQDPDAEAAAAGWSGDFGLVIDRIPAPVAIYLGSPRQGRLPQPEFVDLATLEARAPSYFARASQADWLALIDGSLDVIAAIVQKRLIARGDLAPVLARLKYRGLADRWLERLRAEA